MTHSFPTRLPSVLPARAVEHPVVADARLDVVVVVLGRNAATQIMRRLGLAEAADVVLLAFHRHQRRAADLRSEEHTSELQSLMRISYDVFCLKKKKNTKNKKFLYLTPNRHT